MGRDRATPLSRGHKAHMDRVAHQPGYIIYVEALHQLCAVRLDGLHAHVEHVGHLLRSPSLCDEFEDFTLPGSELLK